MFERMLLLACLVIVHASVPASDLQREQRMTVEIVTGVNPDSTDRVVALLAAVSEWLAEPDASE